MIEIKKEKILFVIHLPPPIHGVSVMNNYIFNSKIIFEQIDSDFINLSTSRDIRELRRFKISKLFLVIVLYLKCIWKFATKKYRYVYITIFPYGFAFCKDAFLVLIAKLLNQRPLLHVHTYGFRRNVQNSRLRLWLSKKVFNNAEVICLSKNLTEDIELFYQGNIFILPNGVPKINSEYHFDDTAKPFVFLYLSNLIKGKGILIVIEAFERILKKGYDSKLRIAGANADITYDDLRKIISEKGISDKVTLVGPVYEEDKLNEYRNCHSLLLPSDYDTFGLVLVEAMQFGVPCISTKMGAIPDVLGEGRGIVIQEINAIALATSMEWLINNPKERKQMSEKSFNDFDSKFHIRIFESNLSEILTGKIKSVSIRELIRK